MAVYQRRQAIVDPEAVGKVCKSQASLRKRKKGIHSVSRNIKLIQNTRTVDRVNFVVMGAARVGKTSLIKRFLYDVFTPGYKETIEDMYHGHCDAHNMRWILQILDTAGAFTFPAMRKLAIESGRVFLLVYSVTDEESFEEVRRVREQIITQRVESPAPIVIVGNKCDMAEQDRFLPKQTLDFIVNIEWGHYNFETSAKGNINVNKAFTEVLQDLAHKASNAESPTVLELEEEYGEQSRCCSFMSI